MASRPLILALTLILACDERTVTAGDRTLKVRATVTVKAGEEVTLPDDTRIRFDSHGHKRTMKGDRSPLIIHGAFAPEAGAALAEFEAQVDPPERMVFAIQGFSFVVNKYEYDRSMELVYFGRVWLDSSTRISE